MLLILSTRLFCASPAGFWYFTQGQFFSIASLDGLWQATHQQFIFCFAFQNAVYSFLSFRLFFLLLVGLIYNIQLNTRFKVYIYSEIARKV